MKKEENPGFLLEKVFFFLEKRFEFFVCCVYEKLQLVQSGGGGFRLQIMMQLKVTVDKILLHMASKPCLILFLRSQRGKKEMSCMPFNFSQNSKSQKKKKKQGFAFICPTTSSELWKMNPFFPNKLPQSHNPVFLRPHELPSRPKLGWGLKTHRGQTTLELTRRFKYTTKEKFSILR